MAKGNLPRIDDAPVKQEQPQQQEARREPAIETVGYLTRAVHTKLPTEAVRVKFKRIARWLDDTGALLGDGNPVGDKKNRVVLWLIENCDAA